MPLTLVLHTPVVPQPQSTVALQPSLRPVPH
jgi:hypothetical protein